MSRIVKAALLQTDWPGSKDKMIDKHESAARDAAKQGAQIMCFQELFYGPYFCQVQDAKYYDYTEYIPDGPTTKPSVLFVCVHNAGRSQMAAGWLRHLSGM